MYYAGSRGTFIYFNSEMLGTYRETYRLVFGTGYKDIADTPACIKEKLFTCTVHVSQNFFSKLN
jgi:hypothetical protein